MIPQGRWVSISVNYGPGTCVLYILYMHRGVNKDDPPSARVYNFEEHSLAPASSSARSLGRISTTLWSAGS